MIPVKGDVTDNISEANMGLVSKLESGKAHAWEKCLIAETNIMHLLQDLHILLVGVKYHQANDIYIYIYTYYQHTITYVFQQRLVDGVTHNTLSTVVYCRTPHCVWYCHRSQSAPCHIAYDYDTQDCNKTQIVHVALASPKYVTNICWISG